MSEVSTEAVLAILGQELKRTLGCTDPSAIGLAGAAAVRSHREAHPEDEAEAASFPVSIMLSVDRNLFKNAFAVGIPNADASGIDLAVVLGCLIADPSLSLRLFERVDRALVDRARLLLSSIPVVVEIDEKATGIVVEVQLRWKDGSASGARIEGRHDRIVWTSLDGTRRFSPVGETTGGLDGPIVEPDLASLATAVASVPEQELDAIVHAIAVNDAASSGSSAVLRGMEAVTGTSSVIMLARCKVLQATWARMSGLPVPVMACGGSGNHGLTLFLSLQEAWKLEGIVAGRTLERGLLLGIVILHLIKERTGVLTSLCGCALSSALAVSASLVWGLGGDEAKMVESMNIVMNSLGGVVCDGAKPSCCFKTSLGAQVALEAALLAVGGVSVDVAEGLAAPSFSALLDELEQLHCRDRGAFDTMMVSILKRKRAMGGAGNEG